MGGGTDLSRHLIRVSQKLISVFITLSRFQAHQNAYSALTVISEVCEIRRGEAKFESVVNMECSGQFVMTCGANETIQAFALSVLERACL